MKKSKIWTKEQGFSVLIDESESRKQMEYNLARAQLGVLGYTAEEVWEEFYPRRSKKEMAELERNYKKAARKATEERKKFEAEASK